ncbi:MAG: ABC transporter ATP-binding protein [Melioribacteraceae bacterium]|nr:ABC transporter ATP-binding protein [Melioribacteraceae bacterium]
MYSLKNLFFSYSQNLPDSFAVKEISLKIDPGEFIGVFGPNGSGKSTLLRLLSGRLKPQKGSVEFLNKNINDYSKRELARKISFVPQFNISLFPFTVYEIVAMGRTPHAGMLAFESETEHEKILSVLESLELDKLANKGIYELSGGEVQRSFIARALVQEPMVLLLDEPNSHLDIKHQIDIYRILKNLNLRDNLTIIAVSHDLNLSANFCADGILLSDGKVFSKDDVKNVLTSENIESVFGVKSETNLTGNNKSINFVFNN